MKNNIIYVCIIGKDYIDLLKLFISSLFKYYNDDLLILTNENTKKYIPNELINLPNIFIHILNENIEREHIEYNGRFRIFEWVELYNYKIAFFVDCDILFFNSPDILFNEIKEDDILYVKSIYSINDKIQTLKNNQLNSNNELMTINKELDVIKLLGYEEQTGKYLLNDKLINIIKEKKYKPINCGQLLFKINKKIEYIFNDIYNDIIKFSLDIPTEIYINCYKKIDNYNFYLLSDQVYFNINIIKNKINVNYDLLDKYCGLRINNDKKKKEIVFYHFAGYIPNKYRYILNIYNKYNL